MSAISIDWISREIVSTLQGLDAPADKESYFQAFAVAKLPRSKLSIAENALENVNCFVIERSAIHCDIRHDFERDSWQ